MSHNCVLIVDDEADLRECLAELLEVEGFHVAQSVNGLEAIRYLQSQQQPPCLILLDYMMPIMDGEAFRNEQLKHANLKNIPVVLLTAATIPEKTLSSMQLSGHVPKPIKIDQFIATVKQFCRPTER